MFSVIMMIMFIVKDTTIVSFPDLVSWSVHPLITGHHWIFPPLVWVLSHR